MKIEIKAAQRLAAASKVTTDELDFNIGMDAETKAALKKLNIVAKKSKHTSPGGGPMYSLTGDKAAIMKYLTTEYGLDEDEAEDSILK